MANELPSSADASIYLADFGQVEQVVARFPGIGSMTMTALMANMTDAGWRSLDLAELLLKRHQPEPRLDDEIVQQLLGKVRELIDEVVASEGLDQGARSALVRRLRRVEEALVSIRVTGTVALEEAAEGVIGHVLNTRPEGRHTVIMRKVVELASAALIAAASAAGAMIPELIAGDSNSGTPQPPVVVIIEQVVRPAQAPLPAQANGPRIIDADSGT